MALDVKYSKLQKNLKSAGRLAVAFSGGTDSTLLLWAAREALGGEVLALTVKSVFIPREEADFAADFCRDNGIRHIFVHVDVLSIDELAQNSPERCYICKKALMSRLFEVAGENGFSLLAEGSNTDDDSDYRPGARAVRELKVLSPLRDCGLGKAEIRELSCRFGLSTAQKPSMACLASRFPYGERITEAGLRAVDEAERYLRGLGLAQLRVRAHGALARIETDDNGFAILTQSGVRGEVYAYFRALGFSYTALDLSGYRTGSMNETIT